MRFGNLISDRRFGEYAAVDASRFRSPVRASFSAAGLSFWISWLPGILAQSVLFVAIFYDMLTGGVSAFGLGADFTILLVAVAIMVIIGGKLYPRVAT